MSELAGMTTAEKYDVVVVGGGAAGLSGALALSRARRSVLVIDAGAPRNLVAGHVHNYLGREDTPPSELLSIGRDEVTSYGGEVIVGRVTSAQALAGDETGFVVTVDDGRTVRGRRLLVTTGLVDELPDVPGLRKRWGRDVLHCPYCHGWEVRGQELGVIASNGFALHQALMFRQWSDDVTLFLNGGPAPSDEAAEQLTARGVAVVPEAIDGVVVEDDRITGVRLASGEVVARQALVVSPRMTARSEVLCTLGIEAVEQEMNGIAVGTVAPSDPTGANPVPGVWVAGNVADVRAQVISSAAAGFNVGAMINADLIAEDTRIAVAARRAMQEMFEQPSWEERYRSKPAIWSRDPNPQVVAETTDLPAGTALDIGSGEGADSLWLAERGWQVTALDFSKVALARAAEHAEATSSEAAGRIDWQHADLRDWAGDGKSYDLVTSQFMHLPDGAMTGFVARLAEAVAPGGTLLVVGHHPSDVSTGLRWNAPNMLFTAEELAHEFDRDTWDVLVAEARPRETPGPDGDPVTVHDAALRARRR
ncbi:MAG TPA: bifunctional NAD(P)/FAD-dependent oxidoreductase/class I SAM-dependent methyltransferase [Dermatophilaceae bacterium]|nr:bifunctional NAD(P)/FAD-dependent oxidoreductase/class I SAM-dependent methyltransferase [Dermatophilaceae bacterium]